MQLRDLLLLARPYRAQLVLLALLSVAGSLVQDVGVPPGARVVVLGPNCPRLVATYFGAFRARIVLANPGGVLKPGKFATVSFGPSAAERGVLVTAEAVIETGKRSVVIVAAGEGRFMPVEVEAGRQSGDLVEIRKGLSVGQRVVVSGQFLIDSEASLRSTLQRLPGAPAEDRDEGKGSAQ